MSMTSIKHLNNEHNDWLRALSFYKDELDILKERLTEVAGKNTGDEASQQADHFENQIKIQVTNIDTLRHDINTNLARVAEEVKDTAGHVEGELIAEHDALRDRFISEEKTINELRHEFNRYAAKWM
ncbi:MAG: hypothetical protein H6551_00405 [Chitinophagales bacterium]|nr:hypothetical protein [Chitinophagaceae bacterium]MCB9063582.1 hypothetical protein [Chitinophagales bacterium]